MNERFAGLQVAASAYGVGVDRIAAVVGHHPATVTRWIEGEGRGFTIGHMLAIQRELLPNVPLEVLTYCETENGTL